MSMDSESPEPSLARGSQLDEDTANETSCNFDEMEEAAPLTPGDRSTGVGIILYRETQGLSGLPRPPLSSTVAASVERRIQPMPLIPRLDMPRVALQSLSRDSDPCNPLGPVMHWLDSADLTGLSDGDFTTFARSPRKEGTSSDLKSDLTLQRESLTTGSFDALSTLPDRRAVAEGHALQRIGTMDTAAAAQSGPLIAEAGLLSCVCAQDRRTRTAQPIMPTDEEMEWQIRKEQTGVSARLVCYQLGDSPRDEMVLRAGFGGRIVVSTVHGKAASAGVRPGDVLASINGNRDLQDLHAESLLEHLQTPVALVFVGFIGKYQAEVRLHHEDQRNVGIKVHEPVGPKGESSDIQVLDEVVFYNQDDGGSDQPGSEGRSSV